MNAPERFNTWRWEDSDNETRLKFEKDTKMPNAGTFIIGKEDHTIGNLLRMQLLRDNSVRFAGYRMPHPLIFDCHVKVQTLDGRTDPIKVLQAALEDLSNETESLERQFKAAMKEYKETEDI